MPSRLKLKPTTGEDDGGLRLPMVALVEGAIGGVERAGNLAALFPHVSFEVLQGGWPDPAATRAGVLIAPADAASPRDLEDAVARLRQTRPGASVIIVLRNADVSSTRRLIQEGAADVLPDPVSEPALALSLERLLTRERPAAAGPAQGEIIAFLKGGGGVGATALAVQVAAMLAQQSGEQASVCLADLDLQFGAAEFYLDLHNTVTISDCLAAGAALGETPFATRLTPHRSGARVLAAPQEMSPLELISPPLVDALFEGLRRNFALTIVDLPADWTAWTNRVLELADRIVLVTQLSVPHTHLVRRQISALQTQRLADKPLTLVCNAVNGDQQATVSLKAAERAIGRPFDVVVPEDRRLMSAAINQGLLIADVKRKTKVEKAIADLAGKIAAGAPVARPAGR